VSTPARYHLIDAKTITRVPGTVDPWFLGRYGMNLYRGCEHGCLYCDGRAERYYVSGDFARDVTVKRNAVELLGRELAKAAAREPGFVLLGGGVCDAYQPAEEQHGLARGALELAHTHHLPVHVLTKASLVERDLELLRGIEHDTRAILSFSIQTLDDTVRARFEPGAAPIEERLRLLGEAKRLGLATGIMAMPVLPGISDQPDAIERLVAQAADIGVDFVCYGALTLRPGVQKRTYLEAVAEHDPSLLSGYRAAYRSERASGAPASRYLERVEERFVTALDRHGLPARPPRRLFAGQIPQYAEVAVLLEHREAAERRHGRGLGVARAGFAVQRWAREQFAKRGRRKDFSWQVLESEFRQRVVDGTIAELPDVTDGSVDLMRSLLP
jgi:DNA repair photolyase